MGGMPIGPLWVATIIVASSTALVSLGLLYMYFKNLKVVKSRFTIGLLAFASAILLQNLLATFLYFQMAFEFPAKVAIPLVILNGVELAGLSVLLWITYK